MKIRPSIGRGFPILSSFLCDAVLPTELKFNADNLTRAIGRDPKFNAIDIIKETNMHGIYKASFKEQVGEKRRMLTAYYIISPELLPQKPGGKAKWYNKIVSSAPQQMHTRQAPVKRSVPVGLVPTNMSTPIQKRRRQNDAPNLDAASDVLNL